MSKHLEREIGSLEKRLLSLSAVAEQNIHEAVKAVEERDPVLAQRVIERDVAVDDLEVVIEEECLKILALHHPVAVDLRFIIGVLKINNDLERVGDLATGIARQAIRLAEMPEIPLPFDVHDMAQKAWSMVRHSIDAQVEMDVKLAGTVRAADREVDEINKRNYDRISEAIRANPESVDANLVFLRVTRALERVADHATNIAEDVIYMLEGDIVRHNPKSKPTREE